MSITQKQSRLSAAKRHAQIERISIAGLAARMGPVGLHTYAEAFQSLQGSTMLKLAERDGHNLETLLRNADEKGLTPLVALTEAQRAAIRQASVYYEGKVFEYPAVGEAMSGYPDMPALSLLFEVAAVLVESLRKPCQEAK
jgi:hypothetical protein